MSSSLLLLLFGIVMCLPVLAFFGALRSAQRRDVQYFGDKSTRSGVFPRQSGSASEPVAIRSTRNSDVLPKLIIGGGFVLMGLEFGYLAVPDAWREHKYLAVAVVMMFPLIGLGLLYSALNPRRFANKSGKGTLLIGGGQGVIGESLSGWISIPTRFPASSTLSLTLECVEVQQTGSARSRGAYFRTIWSENRMTEVHPDQEGSTAAFEFQIPTAARPSGRSGNQGVFWRIKAASPSGETQYSDEFVLVVVQA